jgi:hypothetical protein
MDNNNNPTLNFDMISKILNIRMESKKDDRYKLQKDKQVQHLHEIFCQVDLYHIDCFDEFWEESIFEEIQEDNRN